MGKVVIFSIIAAIDTMLTCFSLEHYYFVFITIRNVLGFILFTRFDIGHTGVTLAGYPVTKINIHNTPCTASRRAGQTPTE